MKKCILIENTPLLAEKLWARVPSRPEDAEACWEFLGYRLPKGYGRLSVGNRAGVYAHRAAWVVSGFTLGEFDELDHLCKNTSCVRPTHLQVVPRGWNGRQGNVTQHLRQRTHCKKGHELTGENVYLSESAWRPARMCRTCLSESKTEYAKKNADRLKAKRSEYYNKNRESIKAKVMMRYWAKRADLEEKVWS